MNELEVEHGLAPTPGYRYANRVGNQLFVAGQVPLNANGKIIGLDNPALQATECLNNLQLLLSVHGFSEKDIQHITVYVVGPTEDLSLAWNSVKEHFKHSVPPATLLGVARLGYPGQLVEIDATVIREST